MCRLLLAVVAIGCSLISVQAEADEARAPNIILILADDLGVGELGCYGQKKIRTPEIDRLAAEGIRFTEFYAGNAVCAPSRCALLTGKHMGHAYVRDNSNPKGASLDPARDIFPGQIALPAEEVTLPELLKDRGYATAAIGKWGLGNVGTPGDPNRQGFDLFYGYNCQHHAHNHYPRFLWRNDVKEALPGNTHGPTGKTYSHDRFADEAVAFVRENRARPFFLYLAVTIPHLALQVPDESLVAYRGAFEETAYNGKQGYSAHPMPRSAYAAMVSHLDQSIGRLMAELKSLQIDEQTLVLFTSDNGPTHDVGGADSTYFQSAAGRRGFKGSLYEGGIRVPLIARWPGKIAPGTTSNHLSAMWDLLPTLCEVATTKYANDIDGLSLLPTLLDKTSEQKQHDYLYWEFAGYGGWQAVRKGPWKAVRSEMLKKNNRQPLKISLYNLDADPAEERDVANEHPKIVAEMERRMTDAHRPSKEFSMPPIDN